MAVIDLVLGIFKVVTFVYDIVTFPIYGMTSVNWKERTRQNLGNVVNVESSDKAVTFRRDKGTNSDIYQEIIVKGKVDTVTKAFNFAVNKYGDQECIGTREVLGETDEVQSSGKVFKKLELGDYRWISYNQLAATAESFGRGLRLLGQEPGTSIAIYAETRAEWMMSCLGAFSQNIHVCTVYTNLGDDAVVHALKETEVTTIVTSHELLPRFKQMLSSLPNIRTIVYLEDQLQKTPTTDFKEGVEIVAFRRVVDNGADHPEVGSSPPTPADTAIVMYTSGSTGTPKGVILTHKNLIGTMKCLMFMLKPKDDIYIGFLPLAHVLELLSENTMLLFGIKVGYSSPNTMTDMSTKVRKGYKGDASVLRPTMMCAVPLIMDRIYKNIIDSVEKRGPTFKKIFEFCFNYKLYWIKYGMTTPLLDKFIFSKISKLLGGKMNFILIGGAPLSQTTHDFIRVCLGSIVVQGYSLTESTCTGTVMENCDLSSNTVGAPMTGLQVKLVDWAEGNYKISDKPNPRGEIILGGDTISKGYFKLPEKTQEDFFEEDGLRWFRTGDVGEFDKNGKLKIVDRKKDLVKLQLGEYVSLGKVEAQLKTHHLVENICVYGDPYQKYTVALVVPSKIHLEATGHQLGKVLNYEDLILDIEVQEAVLKELSKHGLKRGLEKFEIPTALTLIGESWTPESGVITAAFKLKRKVIQNIYQRDIDKMYA